MPALEKSEKRNGKIKEKDKERRKERGEERERERERERDVLTKNRDPRQEKLRSKY